MTTSNTLFQPRRLALAAALGGLSLWSSAALAQVSVQVQGAWARATVQGQMATGAFMTLTADKAGRLVGAASPVAGVTEVHEMKMDGGVMKMSALQDGLALPAGQAVTLKPGGYHVMLMDLKLPLQKDTTIPLILYFQDAKGVKSELQLKVPVQMPSMPPMQGQGDHKH